MSDAVNKKLGYTVEANFSDVGKAIREMMGVFKTLDNTFKEVGKQFEKLTKDIKTDAKSLEKPFQQLNKNVNTGFKEVIKELKSMSGQFKTIKQDMKNTLGYVQQESKTTARSINRIAQESTKTGKAVQAGMKTSASAMKSFAAENKKTQTQLRKFNNEADRTAPKLKNMREEMSNAMNSFGLVAGAISGALTMGIRGVMKEFGDFEQQMKIFEAVSQSTAAEMGIIEEKVLSIGSSTAFTATEVAAASVELSKMGFTAQETIDALDGMVLASIASGETLEETSSIIATTLRTFNMAASESTKVADIIARGANISAQSFQSFALSMKYVGSAAAGANQDLTEVSGMLALLSDRGLKASIAGNGLENALIRLQAQPKATAAALDKLNISIRDTKGTASTADDTMRPLLNIIKDIKEEFSNKGVGKIEQAGILKDLFGEVSLKTMQVFFNTSNDVIDGVMEKQRDYAGSSKETADKIQEGFTEGVKRMESAISALKISIGKELAPTMSKLADLTQGVANGFTNMPKPIQSAIGHMTLFLAGATATFAGVAGVSFLVNQSVNAFGSLNKLMDGKLLTTAKNFFPTVGKLAKALVTGPLAEVILVTGAIYAAFKTNFGGIRDIFADAIDAFNTELLPGWIVLFQDIIGPLSSFKQFFAGVMRDVGERFFTVMAIADQFFGSLGKAIGSASRVFRALLERDFEWLRTESEATLNNVMDALDSFDMSEQKLTRKREAYLKKLFGEYSWETENRKLKEATAKELERIKAKKKVASAQKDINDLEETGARTGSAGLDKDRTKLEIMKDQLAVQEQKLDLQKQEIENDAKRNKLNGGGEKITLSGSGGARTSGYGYRIHPIHKTRKLHTGVDHGLAQGSPIKSDAAGKVAFSGMAGGYGNTIIVDAGDGNYILYAHASKLYKKVGDAVKKGEQIAASGGAKGTYGAGTSTGAHLHSELRKGAAGLVGSAAFGAAPVDPSKGFVQGPSHDGHDHGGSNGSISDVESKRYSDLVAYRSALNKLLTTLKKGTQDYSEAKKELEKINGRIATQEGVLLDLKIDASEALKKQTDKDLKELSDSFKAMVDEPSKAIEEFYKKVDEMDRERNKKKLSKAEFESGETITEINAVLNAADSYSQKLVGLKAQIDNFKSSNEKLTAEQAKGLAELELQYTDVGVALEGVSDKARKYFNDTAIKGAQDDWDAMSDSVLLANKAAIDFMASIEGNDSALQELNAQLINGETTFAKIQAQFKLTDKQVEKLITRLASVEFAEGFEKEVDKSREELAKIPQEISDNIDSINQGVRLISDAFYAFGTNASRSMAQAIDSVQNLGQGLARVFSNDPGGYFQIAQVGFDLITSAIQRAAIETRNLREELMNLAVAQGQGVTVELQRKLFEREKRLSGTSIPSEREAIGNSIRDIKVQIIDQDKNNQVSSLLQEFQQRFGLDVRNSNIGVDESGMPQFQQAFDRLQTDDPRMKAYYQKYAQQTGITDSVLQEFANRVQQIKLTRDQAISDIQDTTAQLVSEESSESIEQATEKNVDKFAEYMKRLNLEKSQENELKNFLNQFDSPEAKEALTSIGQNFISQKQQITTEVMEGLFDGTVGSISKVTAETARRFAEIASGFVNEVQETLRAVSEKLEQEAAAKLKTDSESIKEARKDLLDQQKGPLLDLIDAERQRLDQIEKQNDAIEDQIRLKNKQRDGELSQFDAEDQAKFAALVSGVDYNTALNQGLDDIHNPDGILTGTYSDKTHKEAIDERIALMTLENENKLKLEQQTQAEYLNGQQKIAALQARAADEALKADDLTTRERLELEQTKADAYVDFQRSYREAITQRFDTEVDKLEQSITANNEHRGQIEANIAQHQSSVDALTLTYENDLSRIDSRITAITESNSGWITSVESLKAGVEGPLNKIVELYERAKSAASSIGSGGGSGGGSGQTTGSSNVANYGSSVVSGTGGGSFQTTSELFAANKMAGGGVVPDGYPNDSFFAKLQSKEWVLPEWITTGLTQQFLNPQNNGSKVIQISMTGEFREPGMVQREIVQALRNHDQNGDGWANGAFQGSLN